MKPSFLHRRIISSSRNIRALPAYTFSKAHRLTLSRYLVLAFSLLTLVLFTLASPVSNPLPVSIHQPNGPLTSLLSTHTVAPLTSQPEANIAYFIQVSHATSRHLSRLLQKLYHAQNVYSIHLDRNMDEQVSQGIKKAIFAENSKYKNNVFFMQSEPITYRGISMVLNTINAMKVLLEREEHWDYFINISGSDYPLASPLLQRRLLGRHVKNAFNFMTYSPPEKWGKNAEYRMDNFYVDETLGFKDHGSNIQQLKQINPLAKSLNVEYTNAEAWMINSRDFCQFVVTSGYARKMLLTFAYSADSAEHYFSTLLWNHPVYNRTIVSHAMRQVVWFHEGHEAGQHPFNVDEVDSNGSFIFQKVIKESPNFFVRKFKKNDSAMMDWIDERLNLKERVRKITNHYEWATSKARAENGSKEKVIIEV